MRKVKGILWLTIILAVCAGLVWQHQTAHSSSRYIQSSTPTLFFHGWGSSAHAERHMVNAIRHAGVTNDVIQANVSKNGEVTLSGHLPRHAINPIVMVNYADNKNSDYHQDWRYALDVIRTLQSTYHFKKVNLVGHSMGNMAVCFYLLNNAGKAGLPRLNKQVAIAGHFDGIKGRDLPSALTVDAQTGRPNKMSPAYQQLVGLRDTYPQQAKVLNIYGDIGDHSDGAVTNDSSRTMRYLVADRASSYQEKKINGRNAQHSKLHSNGEVDQVLIDFLWSK